MSEAITKDLEQVEEMNEMEAMMDEIEKSLRLPGRGEIVTGEIVHVTNDYVVVNLHCKKDGVIPKEEMALEQEGQLTELFKEGDEIQAKVIYVSAEERRLGLSIKQIKDDEDRRKPKEFHAGPQEAGQSLGDLLKAAQENN